MPVLSNTRLELYCQAIFEGKSQAEAAKIAKYSERSASVTGNRLFKKASVQARLTELKDQASNGKVLSVAKRKELLSEIALEKHYTQSGLTRMQNIAAIDMLNKMENVYQKDSLVSDNRQYTINVTSPEAKRLLQKVINGEGRLLTQGEPLPDALE